jgi:hypothetical protein
MPQYKTVVFNHQSNLVRGQQLGPTITSISYSQSWMLAGGFFKMRNRDKYKEKREQGQFMALTMQFMRSHVRCHLPTRAQKLLLDILAQYNGSNNGDLCLAWTTMAPFDWRSKDTLAKATADLLEKEIIVLTRQGGKNKASLFALTMFAIDPCRDKNGYLKLDVDQTDSPPSKWLKHEPPPKLKTVVRKSGQ